MKQMRTVRIVILAVLAVLLALLMAGCGGDQASQQQAEKGATQQQGGGKGVDTLSKAKDKGELTIGVKYDTPPFGFIPQGQSQPDGFDIDVGKAIAEKMGVKPRFEQVTSKNRIPNLETGKIDMIIATMTHTQARDKTIDFSETYFLDGQRLLVPEDSSIQGVQDLNGKTVATVQGSTSEVNIKSRAPQAKVLTYQGYPDALQAMLRGEADAVTTDGGILVGLKNTAQDAGKKVKLVGDRFSDEPYGIGVRQGDSAFRDQVNFAIMGMVEDGTYQKLYRKWFKPEDFQEFTPETWPKGS